MKPTKEISLEAKSEDEPTTKEVGEYQHIDEFVKSLDSEELSYLKGCIKGISNTSKGDDANSKEDDTYKETDFED